jgi:hypothetical protein
MPFHLFHCHLEYLMTNWYILRPFWCIFQFWYVVHTKKNVATLFSMYTFHYLQK